MVFGKTTLVKALTQRELLLLMIIAISLLTRLLAIGSTDLIAEEAYYWNYANHLDFGYLDHPPMVALIIKLTTLLFGTNEFGVRFGSISCWIVCAFFSYRLSELVQPNSGKNALFLLAFLPFFFVHSLIITPDLPLIACWSAALYFLYQALVLNKKSAWYYLGPCIGFGMLSKYTIALLGIATLLYLVFDRKSRAWFRSTAPYVCLLMIVIIFLPVIYWNANHHWASFLFQTSRRFQEVNSFSFHQLFGLFILFLTPIGVLEFALLFRRRSTISNQTTITERDAKTKLFIQIFTLTPLFFFSLFSLIHPIKFNWIGPGLLALMPWIAARIPRMPALFKHWLWTAIILLCSYIGILYCLNTGKPPVFYQTFLNKYIDWHDFNQQIDSLVKQAENTYHMPAILVPIDRYNIASELSFYQAKLFKQPYLVIGCDLFDYESLMYRYWSQGVELSHHILVLISLDPKILTQSNIVQKTNSLSSVHSFWARSPGTGQNITPYYYQLVELKPSEV